MDPIDPQPFSDLTAEEARQVDSVCRAFEANWSAGTQGPIGALLPESHGPFREALAFELIALELELRRGRGETPAPGDYLARFPELTDVVVAVFAEERSTLPDGERGSQGRFRRDTDDRPGRGVGPPHDAPGRPLLRRL